MSIEAFLTVLSYFGAINLLTYAMFAWDKRWARQGMWRVPESNLLTLAAMGGTIGAFAGRHLHRHKTRKEPFCMYLRLIFGVQLIVVSTLYFL